MGNGKIAKLLNVAHEAKLDGLDFLARFSYATLVHEYNGIGPEWAGDKIRDWSTARFFIFEPAALIHDLRNYESDGSEDGFIFANREFLDNCLKLANHAYPWYSWRRYRARAVAFALYEFVQGAGGWIAWQQCADKSLSRHGLRPANTATSAAKIPKETYATGTAGSNH